MTALASLMLASTGAQASLAEEAGEALRNAAHPNVLRVVVSGVDSAAGHVRVDVCTRSEFLHDCRFSGAAPATPGVTIVTVKDVPPGIYAIQAYHDRNDNFTVDQNFLGVPTESVGFSNDPAIRFKAPSFKSAAFIYPGGEQAVAPRLRRFFP